MQDTTTDTMLQTLTQYHTILEIENLTAENLSGHSISTCPEKNYTKPLEKPNFQKQTFNQARKGNQNLPNRRVTSNIMTGKPLPFSHHSCSNSREQRSRSRHRSPN